MDVTEWFKNTLYLETKIKENFETFKADNLSPVHPLKSNFKAKKSSFYFCGIPVFESYLYKLDSNYTFYLFVKQNSKLVDLISKKFGPHNSETSFEVNHNPFPTSYSWDGSQNIILSKHHNIWGGKKYENSYLIIFGNMSFRSLTNF